MSFEKAKHHFLEGVALLKNEKFQEAETEFLESLNLLPNRASTLTNLSAVQIKLKKFSDAKITSQQAIRLDENNNMAYLNLGIIEKEELNILSAINFFDLSLKYEANNPEALLNLGSAHHELKRYAEAINFYDRAISLKVDYPEVFFNKGMAYHELKNYEDAIEAYQNALRLKPDFDYLMGRFLYTKIVTCNWHHLDIELSLIIEKVKARKKIINPFIILAVTDSQETQFSTAKIWQNDQFPSMQSFDPIPKELNNKIKIGYFSADFRNHPVSQLIVNLFEKHDRNRFEIIAFSIKPTAEDDKMRQRLIKTFDQFIDVENKSDEEVAQLSRALKVDIAIDLGGFTLDSRTGIFACRAAPVQVNYLGYPGTMAVDFIDYIIADKTLIPAESKKYYAEKIIYLPDSYQVNDRKKIISDKQFSRAELELPENSFVFCCFNNNFKIQPSTFDGWMRILKAVQGSVLWLLQDNEFASKNLKKEAQERGVEASRLVFAKRHPLEEHLARHRQADLFIDTFPYNAHTTASDALWAGLPVLTLMGESFASRVAASLLTAIDLPELITSTQEHYEALAIELATNPAKLKAIKTKLEANRLTTPLFDTPRFTKHLEEAYAKMYERYHADLPPDHIYI